MKLDVFLARVTIITNQGGFGTVRVAKCKKTGKHVALKHLKK